MYRFFVRLGVFFLFVAIFAVGQFSVAPAVPRPNGVVAQVDSHVITVEELQKKLAEITPSLPDKNLEQRKGRALEQLITDYLINRRAQSIRLEEDTAFVRKADYLLAQVETRELFSQMIVAAVSVADSEIVAGYEQHREEYRFPEWVHAGHILISSVKDSSRLTAKQKETGWWADTDEKALAMADSLQRMIIRGASFEKLAGEWSQDKVTGVQGGDLGKFGRGQMVTKFDSVVFSLKPGAISAPVKTQFGYHIIKVLEKQEAGPVPLSDSLKQVITEQLRSEKAMARAYAFLDSVQEKAGLTFNQEIFSLPDSVLRRQKLWAVASGWGDTAWSEQLAGQLLLARQMSAGKEITRQQKLDILKTLINPLLIHRASRDLSIPQSEAYLKQKEQIYQNERLSRVRRPAPSDYKPVYKPADEEIRNYFNGHRAEFAQPETSSLHVQQVVFKTKREAEQAFREWSAGADFALLAKKYYPGDADIGEEAFDLGFISFPAMPKEFFAVAETLTLQTVSRPVKTEWGYHLLRVVERKPDLAFEAARPKIADRLRKAKQENYQKNWEEALREGHSIRVDARVLRRVKDRFPKTAGDSSAK